MIDCREMLSASERIEKKSITNNPIVGELTRNHTHKIPNGKLITHFFIISLYYHGKDSRCNFNVFMLTFD